MREKQGSITVYLCLTLTIIFSLFAAMLQSVRAAGGRAMIASATEQGLYSLFAQYDKALLEEYDLFFIDGGYGGPALQLGRLYDSVCEDAVRSLNPSGHGDSHYGNFFGAELAGGEITGYTLAVDQTGNSFTRQVTEYMEKSLGVSGIQQLSDILSEQSGRIENQDYEKKDIAEEDPVERYEREKEEGEAQRESGEPSGEQSAGQNSGAVEDPSVVNPIEVIRDIRKMGLLGLVVKDPGSISNMSEETSGFPSNRELQQGMCLYSGEEAGILDKVMMLEYIMQKFPCYTDHRDGGGLKYQIESVIGGKGNDMDNLKAVVNRLIAVREAANLVYLYAAPAKRAQAETLAAALASSLLLPVAEPIIALALMACWAFAESILDVRELLEGGKVPLLKEDGSWQLALEKLPDLLDCLDEKQNDEKGFDYQWYLRFLLFVRSGESLTTSAMDLVEYNMNLKNPDTVFRIDNCVDRLEVDTRWSVSGQEYHVCRSYSYGGKDN